MPSQNVPDGVANGNAGQRARRVAARSTGPTNATPSTNASTREPDAHRPRAREGERGARRGAGVRGRAHRLVLSFGIEQHDDTSATMLIDDVDGGEQHRDALHGGDVARDRRPARAPARARVGEDRLDDDDAADQVLDREREHLHGRARVRSAARGGGRRGARGCRSGAPSRRSRRASPRSLPTRTMRITYGAAVRQSVSTGRTSSFESSRARLRSR